MPGSISKFRYTVGVSYMHAHNTGFNDVVMSVKRIDSFDSIVGLSGKHINLSNCMPLHARSSRLTTPISR